jgi:hypothetical protein
MKKNVNCNSVMFLIKLEEVKNLVAYNIGSPYIIIDY